MRGVPTVVPTVGGWGVGSRRGPSVLCITEPRIAKDFSGHAIRSPVQADV
jgi:hypothetical protein